MYVELYLRCKLSMDIIYHLEHTFRDKIVCPEQTPHGFLILCTICDNHDKNKQKMLQNTQEAFFYSNILSDSIFSWFDVALCVRPLEVGVLCCPLPRRTCSAEECSVLVG